MNNFRLSIQHQEIKWKWVLTMCTFEIWASLKVRSHGAAAAANFFAATSSIIIETNILAHASKYIFSWTTMAKPSQIFLISSKESKLSDVFCRVLLGSKLWNSLKFLNLPMGVTETSGPWSFLSALHGYDTF